jgi:hypothetical protein
MTCQQCLALYLGIDIPVTTRALRAAVIGHLFSCPACLTTARDVCRPYASGDLTFAPLWTDADLIDPEFVAVVASASRRRKRSRRA